MIESFFQIFSMASLLFNTFQTNKKIKEKHLASEQEKEKERIKVQTKDNTPKHRTHNGKTQEEKPSNLRPKPITSNTKQVMQGDV
jgi:hypothetical protein